MESVQVLPSIVEAAQEHERAEATLRAWDWQAELRNQDRSKAWLARQLGTTPRNVYAYAYAEVTAPVAWLRKVAAILARGSV